MDAPKSRLTTSPTATSSVPTVPDETIRARAYQLYEERGKQDGKDLEDWLRAEEELREKVKAVAA